MEHLWNRAGATGGNRSQMRRPRQRLKQANPQPVATHGNGFGAHGKEGVDGSSPSEGFTKGQEMAFCVALSGTEDPQEPVPKICPQAGKRLQRSGLNTGPQDHRAPPLQRGPRGGSRMSTARETDQLTARPRPGQFSRAVDTRMISSLRQAPTLLIPNLASGSQAAFAISRRACGRPCGGGTRPCSG
jgi:hypothetical protein